MGLGPLGLGGMGGHMGPGAMGAGGMGMGMGDFRGHGAGPGVCVCRGLGGVQEHRLCQRASWGPVGCVGRHLRRLPVRLTYGSGLGHTCRTSHSLPLC